MRRYLLAAAVSLVAAVVPHGSASAPREALSAPEAPAVVAWPELPAETYAEPQAPPAPPAPAPEPEPGDPAVRARQVELRDAGFDPGPIDGVYGPLTARAERRSRGEPEPAPPPVTRAPVAPPPSGDCYGVNQWAAYIYMHESGCNPANGGNPNCEGIGQACPRGKMGCSWTDVACQLAYFEGYALSRYGSWEAAYNFWVANHWW